MHPGLAGRVVPSSTRGRGPGRLATQSQMVWWRAASIPVLDLFLFAVALVVLDHVLAEYQYDDIAQALPSCSSRSRGCWSRLTARGATRGDGRSIAPFPRDMSRTS